MKSGDYSFSHENEYHRKEFSRISNRIFTQKTFSSQHALFAREAPRFWREFRGEQYDPAKFELVRRGWDHEHCTICCFKIEDGFTYWENA